jgi:hypothetical protein
MHAELSISHRELTGTSVRDHLEHALGQHDAQALSRSGVGGILTSPGRHLAAYATHGPTYTLVCWPVSPSELHVFVEPRGADVRAASVSAWLLIRQALVTSGPRLGDIEVFARPLGRVALEGTKGFLTHLGHSTTVSLLGLGVANLGLLIWGWNGFAKDDPTDLLIGTVPGLATAALQLAVVGWWWVTGFIRWRIK